MRDRRAAGGSFLVFPPAVVRNLAPGNPGGFSSRPREHKIACQQCGHVGVVCAESLPRELVCSRCGEARQLADGAPIRSKEAILEWHFGGRSARVRRLPTMTLRREHK